MDSLSGSVERITYYNPENGYTVLRLRPEHGRGMQAVPKASLTFDGLATVVGNLPEVSPGEFLRLQGQWRRHPGLSWLGHDQGYRPQAGRADRGPLQGGHLPGDRAEPRAVVRDPRHRH